jgi:hypothetical protein
LFKSMTHKCLEHLSQEMMNEETRQWVKHKIISPLLSLILTEYVYAFSSIFTVLILGTVFSFVCLLLLIYVLFAKKHI